MPRHIGIVACSAEGAALCYRTICIEGAQLLGSHDHPEVSMHTHSLAEYMKHVHRGDWQGVGELMLLSATKLAKIGADFLICPDNTIHQALPYIQSRSPVVWLHIARGRGWIFRNSDWFTASARRGMRLNQHSSPPDGTLSNIKRDDALNGAPAYL